MVSCKFSLNQFIPFISHLFHYIPSCPIVSHLIPFNPYSLYPIYGYSWWVNKQSIIRKSIEPNGTIASLYPIWYPINVQHVWWIIHLVHWVIHWVVHWIIQLSNTLIELPSIAHQMMRTSHDQLTYVFYLPMRISIKTPTVQRSAVPSVHVSGGPGSAAAVPRTGRGEPPGRGGWPRADLRLGSDF